MGVVVHAKIVMHDRRLQGYELWHAAFEAVSTSTGSCERGMRCCEPQARVATGLHRCCNQRMAMQEPIMLNCDWRCADIATRER